MTDEPTGQVILELCERDVEVAKRDCYRGYDTPTSCEGAFSPCTLDDLDRIDASYPCIEQQDCDASCAGELEELMGSCQHLHQPN